MHVIIVGRLGADAKSRKKESVLVFQKRTGMAMKKVRYGFSVF